MDSLEDRLAAALDERGAVLYRDGPWHADRCPKWVSLECSESCQRARALLAEYRASREPCTAGPDGGPCSHDHKDSGGAVYHAHNRDHCRTKGEADEG